MKVHDYMSINPVTIHQEESLLKARNIMKQQQLYHLPVMGDNNELVGIINYHTILSFAPSSGSPINFWEMLDIISRMKVEDVMGKHPVTINPDSPIENASTLMRDENVEALPVMNQNVLEGIITDHDIHNAFTDIIRVLRKSDFDFSSVGKKGSL